MESWERLVLARNSDFVLRATTVIIQTPQVCKQGTEGIRAVLASMGRGQEEAVSALCL